MGNSTSFVILGGIYSGRLAVSEAAAATVSYVLIVTVLIRREIVLVKLPRVAREALLLVGAILVILGFSLALTRRCRFSRFCSLRCS